MKNILNMQQDFLVLTWVIDSLILFPFISLFYNDWKKRKKRQDLRNTGGYFEMFEFTGNCTKLNVKQQQLCHISLSRSWIS